MNDSLLSQASTSALDEDRSVDPRLVARARALAADGVVLLRNAGEVLPLPAGQEVALFGRLQKQWLPVGYGSGGDVNAPYVTNLLDSLRESGAVAVDEELAGIHESWCAENPADPGLEWGAWPLSFPEMSLDDEVVRAAAGRAGVAVVVIGRAAGEDRESLLEPGSYYLTEAERTLLTQVTAAFDRTVVVIDAGNMMDLAWVEEYPIDAVVFAWLGGMEGARALADVLTGVAEPGGRLPMAVARAYEDYPSAGHFGDPESNDYVEDVFVGYRYFETFAPEAVLFPFGFGLGYTTFETSSTGVREADGTMLVRARVTNTGVRAGREVVQAYVHRPDGRLSQPARTLEAFARTGLLEPGASEDVELGIALADLASYDDAGVTGHRSARVLEPGEYRVLIGPDVRRAASAGSIEVSGLRVVTQLEEAAAVDPAHGFERMALRRDPDGTARVAWEPVPTRTTDLRQRILDRLPEPVGPATGEGGTLGDVAAGRIDLDEFIAQLRPEDLASLAYGDITMDSPLGPPGNAGALGGVTEALRDRGVPAATTTDGPSGIRLSAYASLLPCGTALAASWDPQAVRELAVLHAEEMLRKGSHILLSPGMNIHRSPLCGRNFEYFSEDPLVTGRMAAAVVGGLQSRGVSACPKHFAANNQETNRVHADSRVSERALREIYLRGFEICVRAEQPMTIMTSYNRINGVWAHYHHDLVTTILRGEWGYEGNVVTDWWMRMAQDPDFPALRDSAYRIRAGVDVLMPGSIAHSGTEREDSIMDSHARQGGITLGEMQRTARHVLGYLLRAGLVTSAVAGESAAG